MPTLEYWVMLYNGRNHIPILDGYCYYLRNVKRKQQLFQPADWMVCILIIRCYGREPNQEQDACYSHCSGVSVPLVKHINPTFNKLPIVHKGNMIFFSRRRMRTVYHCIKDKKYIYQEDPTHAIQPKTTTGKTCTCNKNQRPE